MQRKKESIKNTLQKPKTNFNAMKKILLGCAVLLFLFSKNGISKEWLVPSEFKNQKNPLEYTLENVKKGKDLFMANCKSCHGEPGKNNALPLVPPPPDVISELMQQNTQGELFYKIAKGRGGMPQFEKTISEDDRWRLVNYIQNYNPGNTPLLVDAPPVNAKLLASVNEPGKMVEIFAEYEDEKGNYLSLSDAVITISAKKAFGDLPIGQAVSNSNGRAEFKIPETLIGDEEGYVNIVVSLEENYKVDPVILEKSKVATPKKVPQLIKKEILWSTNENIQTWLLLSYIGAAGAAWITIGYVLFQILKVKRLSKEE